MNHDPVIAQSDLPLRATRLQVRSGDFPVLEPIFRLQKSLVLGKKTQQLSRVDFIASLPWISFPSPNLREFLKLYLAILPQLWILKCRIRGFIQTYKNSPGLQKYVVALKAKVYVCKKLLNSRRDSALRRDIRTQRELILNTILKVVNQLLLTTKSQVRSQAGRKGVG